MVGVGVVVGVVVGVGVVVVVVVGVGVEVGVMVKVGVGDSCTVNGEQTMRNWLIRILGGTPPASLKTPTIPPGAIFRPPGAISRSPRSAHWEERIGPLNLIESIYIDDHDGYVLGYVGWSHLYQHYEARKSWYQIIGFYATKESAKAAVKTYRCSHWNER